MKQVIMAIATIATVQAASASSYYCENSKETGPGVNTVNIYSQAYTDARTGSEVRYDLVSIEDQELKKEGLLGNTDNIVAPKLPYEECSHNVCLVIAKDESAKSVTIRVYENDEYATMFKKTYTQCEVSYP